MFISIILIGLSLYIIYKGEVGVTATRRLSKSKGRMVGLLMFIISVLQYMFIDGPWAVYGAIWGMLTILAFFGAIVLAFVWADKVPAASKTSLPPAVGSENPEQTTEQPEDSQNPPEK